MLISLICYTPAALHDLAARLPLYNALTGDLISGDPAYADNHAATVAHAILDAGVNTDAAPNTEFYAYDTVSDSFTTFDTFTDIAFQCIEAQTFGYTCDNANGVIYVFDATNEREL